MLFNETFTVFHFNSNDELEKIVLKNCYAHTISGKSLSKDASRSENTKVLILYQDNLTRIDAGDLIVLEEVDPLYTSYTLEREIRADYPTYIIQSIQDCKQGNTPHYELICK